jgi:P-type conjugative transfer protein TrbJ
MKKFTISIILAASFTVNLSASGAIAGATEFTQLAQWAGDQTAWSADYAKQVNQLNTQMNQLQQDIMGVQMMTQNLQDLSNFDWQDFAVNVSNLKGVMQSANALSYTMGNFDQMFSDNYKGYANYYSTANSGSLTPGQKAESFSQQYQQLNTNTRNTIKGTLDSLGLQEDDFSNEASIINTLKSTSAGAAGNKAVIQAANDIALFQVDQMRKLRSTVMSQINLQSQYMATENEKNEISEAQLQYRRTQGINPVIGNEVKKSKW